MGPLIRWVPPAASPGAARFDAVFYTWLGITVVVAIGIFAVMLWFLVRYRAGHDVDRSAPPVRNAWLETAWIGIPLVIFLAMGTWGAVEYASMYRRVRDAVPVYVVAKQWMWKLQHANGRREIDELHLPAGIPVRLVMTSQDVIHSFYAPALRLKQDLVPGRYTSVSFTPTVAGVYDLRCSEYCGTHHATMGGHIVVMAPDAYARWLAQGTEAPGLATHGFDLFRRYGCSGCHSPRSSVHAPDLTGLIGRTVHLSDGRALVADENYVRDSILLPRKDVVAGYEPIMPSFAGQIGEEDIAAIIHYLRSGRRP